MEEENIDNFLATLANINPKTREITQKSFDAYDLKYEISNLKLIEKSDQKAKVEFVQITKKVSGPEFRDNKIIGIHTLKFINKRWKISSTQINEIKYLDVNDEKVEK